MSAGPVRDGPARAVLPIRPAAPVDAPEVARLLTVLGHPTTAAEVAERWPAWAAAGAQAFVAERADGTLAGLVTVSRMLALHRPRPVGRISSLVVDAGERGRGSGRALVAAAEAALREAGCGLVELTTNRRRTDAHAFYERIGYEWTSLRFARAVAPAG